MKRSKSIMVVFVLFIVATGGALFMLLNKDVASADTLPSFQAWLWERRGLDLIVQVLLVFSGALGIAAILPIEDE